MEGGPIVVNLQEGDEEVLNLPAGFRFHPTDEEVITHYLTQKIVNPNFDAIAIGEVDLNKCEPWDLPKKAKMGEKEWYFFCQRDRKYPTGMRTNRATEMGYWKATGKDKEIYGKGKAGGRDGGGGQKQLVGMKKTLVFYKGRAPKGEKSNWVMHEFRLDGKLPYHNFPVKSQDEWVVCKVFHKNTAVTMNKKSSINDLMRMNSFVEGLLDNPSLPPLMDTPYHNSNTIPNATSSFPNQIQMQQQQHQPPPQIATNHIYNYQMPNAAFFSPTPNNYPYQASSSSNYLHQQKFNPIYGSATGTGGLDHRQCKVEQFSSNLSRSQDTGLSTELTAEISSKQEVDRIKTSFNEDIEGHHLSDLESFWNFQV